VIVWFKYVSFPVLIQSSFTARVVGSGNSLVLQKKPFLEPGS